MSQTVDYYVSLSSPFTYMGHARLYEIAAKHGATVNAKVMNLATIFPKTGGLPLLKRAPERRAYRMMELKRWRAHLDVELTLEPKFFPVDERPAARMVIAAEIGGLDHTALIAAYLHAVWAEERDIADAKTVIAIADEQGLDGAALARVAETPPVEDRYAAHTEEALAKGVFGAPAYVYRDELFWGQDRLDFLDHALAG